MKALQVFAGPRARLWLRERGLRPADVRVIPAAAGGPKGLVLNPLDRFIFGQWLAGSTHTVHLLGASIGAWRMASAALADPDAALARMADDYVHQHYDHAPGRQPEARHVSEVLGAQLHRCFDGREAEVLGHPRFRLHLFTSAGRGLLRREGRWRTPAGYAAAFAANLLGRQGLGRWLERVVVSDARDELPFPLTDFHTQRVALSASNLVPAVLASCSIPFWLQAVHDLPGSLPGAHWDGGITDYHLHLGYAAMTDGLVLYPHFQPRLVPGWLDKSLTRRHRATAALDNVVLLAPHPDWVRTLPGGKLPDRSDFKAFGDDLASRVAAWGGAVQRSQELADEFAALVQRPSIDAQPLP
ncbi:patatin-like phospholipase family protein [Ideonella sp. A 288]|uniref:patatin-like phospholipase family protein n=1 Tax=Ideonella sp. A 288 TaxID=1962181 RepID=UPI000B4AF7D5|nr:patatin-like phospholipase family protein [Ideonella sp. A 288]